MYKSKLVSLLKTLSNKEMKQLNLFLNSPYFNTNEQNSVLLKYCSKHHPNYNESQTHLDRKKAFEYLFSKQTFDEQKLRYLMADLTAMIERFLVVEKKLEERDMALGILESYNERKTYSYFHNTFKKHQKKLEKGKIRNIDYFLHQYQVHNEKADVVFDESNQDFESLLKVDAFMDTFYIANKLRYACLITNFQNIVRAEHQAIFIKDILRYIEANNVVEQEPVIHIYYLTYQMITNPDNGDYFAELMKQLEEHQEVFEQSEVNSFYSYAQNFCVHQINNGKTEYQRDLFELYKKMLESGGLLQDGALQWQVYYNIALSGIRLGDFDFVEQFIGDYKNKVDKEHRGNVYSYLIATLHFHKKEYGKTLKLLNTVAFDTPFYHLMTKTLMIQTYYELGEFLAVEPLLEAFGKYIKINKKIGKHSQKVYSNFVRYVKGMKNEKMGKRKVAQKLLIDLETDKSIAALPWIKEKLEELVNGKK